MGLASAWALARRGAQVTVLERFGHVHDHGSHGGHTRAIRHAYHEGSSYVSMIQQADREWVALGERAEQSILMRTGVLLFGPPQDAELRSAFETCRSCALPYERLDAEDIRARWPLVMPGHWQACFDPSGGYLRVRAGMDALAAEARAEGARLRYGAEVAGLEVGPRPGVRLVDGERLDADHLVVAAGPWLPSLCPTLLPGGLRRLRRILAWTRPSARHHAALSALPVWGVYSPRGFFYGFPHGDEGTTGLKIALHTSADQPALDRPVDPEHLDRQIHPEDLDPLRWVLAEHLPAGQGQFAATHVCMYTSTPGWDFVLDRLPSEPNVVVAGGFSGHGFKFAPAVGLHVAALVLDGAAPRPEFEVAAHRPR